MKLVLIIIISIFSAYPILAQQTREVSIEYQEANEPPRTPAPPKYLIEFHQDKKGNLLAKNYFKNKKKIKFNSPQTIDNQTINTINQWLFNNKNTFTLNDLGVDYSSLISAKNTSKYQLNFDIPENFVLKIDSFNFCQQHRMERSISFGGYFLKIAWKDNSGKETTYLFDSNDIGEAKFNLQAYLFCYQLLKGIDLPEFAKNNIFTPQNLLQILLFYQQTVECEGFYYQEFNKKNPQRTPQERRMMKDWNFIEYMQKRENKR